MSIIAIIGSLIMAGIGLYIMIGGFIHFSKELENELKNPHEQFHDLEVKRAKNGQGGAFVIGAAFIIGAIFLLGGATGS